MNPDHTLRTQAILLAAVFTGAFQGSAQELRVELKPAMLTNEAEVGDPSGLIDEPGVDIVFDGGLLYASNGTVIDPGSMTVVGTIPARGAMVTDAAHGRVYFFSGTTVSIADATEFDILATIEVPDAEGSTRIARWGTDGLAFAGGPQTVVIRSPLIPR